MREARFAATQFASHGIEAANLDLAEAPVRAAAAGGAYAILLQELVASDYSCRVQGAFRDHRPVLYARPAAI